MNTVFSIYALERAQQRGIPSEIVGWLLSYGAREYDKRGAIIRYFNKKSRNRLHRVVSPNIWGQVSKFLNAYAVVSQDGLVVTVGHRTQRINRKGVDGR